ncbi:uncharacterized protein LOC124702012 [Lolium rigidum]|uniref:uncharacterized protein LOC124702012 n=1 Tax=Lolium rigidum TaxID=89674 RepID=UPI001F5C522F|nr:uncharacterized protein LOC124702012 [Lolium rigidum]
MPVRWPLTRLSARWRRAPLSSPPWSALRGGRGTGRCPLLRSPPQQLPTSPAARQRQDPQSSRTKQRELGTLLSSPAPFPSKLGGAHLGMGMTRAQNTSTQARTTAARAVIGDLREVRARSVQPSGSADGTMNRYHVYKIR